MRYLKTNRILILAVFMITAQEINAEFSGKTGYYLIVANEHYSIEFEKFEAGFSGLTNLEEASVSADYIQQYFKEWGIRKGIILKSTPERKLTSKLITAGVMELIQLIRRDKASKNAIVYFYYAGHGFSSKKLQALYLPNGDFTRNPDSLAMEDWDKYATVALDLHEQFQKEHLPHLMLFDCCYNGRQDSIGRLSSRQIQNLGLFAVDKLMGETNTLLTAMFRMVGPDPVIFSTQAGNNVPTVPLNDQADSIYVAPLCRRLGLLKVSGSLTPVSDIKAWMKQFLSKDFDPLTSSAISFWEPE
jgi:hypothetical protein